jgi:predicted Zn-dependent protease
MQIEFSLANAYYLSGDIVKAELLYRKLHAAAPQDGRFAYNLAETLFTQEKYKEALPLFKDLSQRGDAYPSAYTRVAHCLEKVEGVAQAQDVVNEFLSTHGDKTPVGEELKKEAQRLKLAQKISEGEGTVRMKDLQEIFSESVQSESVKVEPQTMQA